MLIPKEAGHEFEEALFGIVLCFYLSYIGYLLVPAVGPRFTLTPSPDSRASSRALHYVLQETLNRLEHNKTDAFPERPYRGRAGQSLLCVEAEENRLFRFCVPVVPALIFSTVYLRYHYVIDVIAGIALAGLTRPGTPGNENFFRRSRSPARSAA